MMMRAGCSFSLSTAANSRPVMPGISMSVTTTSGRVSRASLSASLPLAARATISMSSSMSRRAASAPNMSDWSSAMSTLIMESSGAGAAVLEKARPGDDLGVRRLRHGFSQRQAGHDAGAAAPRFDFQRAVERAQALTHAPDAVALLELAAAAVVLHYQLGGAVVTMQPDAATTRPGMAHDVGHRFPQHQGEQVVMAGRAVLAVDLRGEFHFGRAERHAGVDELSGDAAAAVAAHRLAYLAQRLPGDAFQFPHLAGGAVGIAFQHACREFGLHGDQCQGMTQQVVQVAGDALALRGGRQAAYLLLGLADHLAFGLVVGEPGISGADDASDHEGG